ncbi:MAG: DNA-binding protein Alba [Candidatus Helarchaeota archaeon]
MNHNKQNFDNIVFVGNSKPPMKYVTAIVTISHQHKPEIIIRARGNAISKAVDVVEMVRRQFLPDLQIKNIAIGTEKMKSHRGLIYVSTIEIILENPNQKSF